MLAAAKHVLRRDLPTGVRRPVCPWAAASNLVLPLFAPKFFGRVYARAERQARVAHEPEPRRLRLSKPVRRRRPTLGRLTPVLLRSCEFARRLARERLGRKLRARLIVERQTEEWAG